MRLAFCLTKYFPFGGMQQNFMAISQECLRLGHTVDVYAALWEGEKPAGIKINTMKNSQAVSYRRVNAFAQWLRSVIPQENYDIVMGFDRLPCLDVYYAADVCYTARIQEHRSILSKITPRYRVFSSLEKTCFSPDSQTKIICLSRNTKENYQTVYNTQEERFHLIPPWIKYDIEQYLTPEIRKEIRDEIGLKENDIFLLMIGSSFRNKGVDRSIRALASLSESLRDKVFLVVVGDGKNKRYLKLARKFGIAENVLFMGGRNDVPRFLAGADFLLQPSISENTGNAIVEALVSGVPVLATEACGYAHHVNNAEAGKIIPSSPFQQQTMNSLLAEMITSKEQEQWRKNAHLYAAQLDLHNRPQIVARLLVEFAEKK